MGKNDFTFIIGGARSGKSSFAQDLAKKCGKKVAFIATCEAKDAEMRRRIALHKKARPKSWKVIEEPLELSGALKRLGNKFDTVIIDCLGLLVSNLLSSGLKETKIIKKVSWAVAQAQVATIVVSNEVGMGLVSSNPLARKFCDTLGFINQRLAKKADTVYFMHAGIPRRLK